MYLHADAPLSAFLTSKILKPTSSAEVPQPNPLILTCVPAARLLTSPSCQPSCRASPYSYQSHPYCIPTFTATPFTPAPTSLTPPPPTLTPMRGDQGTHNSPTSYPRPAPPVSRPLPPLTLTILLTQAFPLPPSSHPPMMQAAT